MSWQSPNLSIFIGRLAHRTGHLLYETNNWTFQSTPPHLYVIIQQWLIWVAKSSEVVIVPAFIYLALFIAVLLSPLKPI